MVNTMFVLDRSMRTTYILTANKNSQNAFWDDVYTQELDTGAETLEFSCYVDDSIAEGNYVTFPYNNMYKLFSIMEIEETHKDGRIVSTCYCEIASLELLNHFVRPFNGDMNCIQFFETLIADTDWQLGYCSDSLKNKIQTVEIKKIDSAWSLIEEYKEKYKCEINVRADYSNGRVTGRYLDLYKEGELGDKTRKRFEYGRNVTGIVKKKDLYDWCTGIIIDVECDVTDTIFEEGNGFGFVKNAGDVILDKEANDKYNGGRGYVLGVYSGKEVNPMEACLNAWEDLQKRKVPKFNYNVTTALTEEEYEDIHIGDTVNVIDYSYTPPLFLEARVGTLELSFTDGTSNSCTLTNYKEVKGGLLDGIDWSEKIDGIISGWFPIGGDKIENGAIDSDKINTQVFDKIQADIVEASTGIFDTLIAENLRVVNADIENLRADKAEIKDLIALQARIGILDAGFAEIDTLVNGHLTSDNIQSLIISGDKFTIVDGFIKDAMIENLTANKINSGVLNTNNVQIQSEDGSMLLQGNLQQFKDKDDKVRIQIGKDAQGNFTFCLFSQDGQGVLIDENGIKSGAIGDGLIVDAMVSDGANIQGGKLDINSVITTINNAETAIKSSKIFLDEQNQSLEVAFDALKTKVETIEDVSIEGDLSSVMEQVTSNTSSLNIMQGQIASLIANTTITKQNGEVVQMKDEYNSTKQTVDGNVTKIGKLESNYSALDGSLDSVISKQASMELDLNGFKTSVSDTYATKVQLEETNSDVENAQDTATEALNNSNANAEGLEVLTSKQASFEVTLDKISSNISAIETTQSGTLMETSIQYYLSDSTIAPVGGEWVDVAPEWVNEKYMWQRMKYTYVGGDIVYGSEVCIAGAKGDTGEPGKMGVDGATGVGIASVSNHYLATSSSSGVTINTAGWTVATQSVSADKKYLWNYETITFTDNTTIQTNPCIIGAYGDTGPKGEDGIDGIDGIDGVGISKIEEFYQVSTSNTNTPTSWETTPPALTATNKYLWNYERVTYTDGTYEDTAKKVIGVYGDKGNTGPTGPQGETGKGVSGIVNYYLATNTSANVTTSTSGWTTSVQSVSANRKYLWNYEVITYTDSSSISTTPCIIGAYGDQGLQGEAGADGADGADGLGIKSIVEYYQVSTSSTQAPSSWSTTPPTMTATNKYLWNYERVTYTNNSYVDSAKRVIGVYGDKGATGATGATGSKGQSLVSSVPQYYLSTSKTTQSGGSWSTTMPTISSNRYLWVRFQLTWQNPSSTTYTTPTLEQVTESVKVVQEKQATMESDLNGFKTTVSNTYLSKNSASSTYATKTEVTQTADKINWVVKSGTSSSNMQLTDRVYTLVSNNISLTASNINLHGYVTANGNFKIDTAGNLICVNGKFSGTITGSVIETSPVESKYMKMETIDLSGYNGSTRVISLGFRNITNPTTYTVNPAPSLYMGADGINLKGGTSYTGKTGRYYGRLIAYGPDNVQDYDSQLSGIPYLELNFNTKFTSDTGNPTTNQIRMGGNGRMYIAAAEDVEIRSHHDNGSFQYGEEATIATFTALNPTSYYTNCMEIRAISNTHNSQGLILADKYYDNDGVGDNYYTGAFWTAVSVDSSIDSSNSAYRAFKPIHNGMTNLGTSNYRWKNIYATNGTINTSDRRAKENIQYLTNVKNARLTTNEDYTKEVVEYVKNIPYATFNMTDQKEDYLGFILQDLIEMNPDLTNELMLDEVVIMKGEEDEDIPLMGYRTSNYINMLGLTIQHLLKEVEALKGE